MAYRHSTKKYKKLHYIWVNMMSKCYRPEWSNSYRYYGARGIKVCPRWQESFDNFMDDMYPSYKVGLTLDRINNDGDYAPDNCRWATRKQQASNRRSNVYIEINGISQTLTQWIEQLELKRSTVTQRYYVYKWSAKKSLGLE